MQKYLSQYTALNGDFIPLLVSGDGSQKYCFVYLTARKALRNRRPCSTYLTVTPRNYFSYLVV